MKNDNIPSIKALSRRTFLMSAAAYTLTFTFSPFRKADALPVSSKLSSAANGKLQFFTPHEAAVIGDVASHVVPADQSPGAGETDVLYDIDAVIAKEKKYQKVMKMGVLWADRISSAAFGKKYMQLNEQQRFTIVTIAATGSAPDSLKDKVSRTLYSSRVAKSFFAITKHFTMESFYSGKTGWTVVGYEGPPQWRGNRKYHQCS